MAIASIPKNGLNKHLSMLLIKMHLSHQLKLDVPIPDIWNFLHSHWNMRKADQIETNLKEIKRKNFEIPQTEDWIKIIEEQGALIDKYNDTNTGNMVGSSGEFFSLMLKKSLGQFYLRRHDGLSRRIRFERFEIGELEWLIVFS
ncbi:PREDICTED: uncharacterized protein LOC107165660 [Diuraphis noxia]|uniref:uncharacterized protein LOC107165660 n=1 Tax=Diuraphis noxia TaxID=143948 RepID=UPI0007637051|nr:PREDICTED: uncharacterized protein LOC107165660 [Diuraphis noxia]